MMNVIQGKCGNCGQRAYRYLSGDKCAYHYWGHMDCRNRKNVIRFIFNFDNYYEMVCEAV